MRKFLAVDTLVDACVFVIKHYSNASFLNVGTGREISIADFVRLVADGISSNGELVYDTARGLRLPHENTAARGARRRLP